VVRLLLREESIRTNELIAKSGIQPARFHVLMKALVLCQVVDRKVHDDRSVSYSISPFGKNVLELSEPLLHKIKEAVKDKNSALLSLIQRKG
jgi:DNA-binding HxlR family transcriptional regulator